MGRQRGEGAGQTTRPCQKEAHAVQAPAGGAPGERAQGGRGDDGGQGPAPLLSRGKSAAPRACAVLATCLRRTKDSEGAPPPPTPYSPTHQGKGRGQRGGGEGTWGGDRGQTDVRGEETGGERWKKKTTTNKAYQRARGRKREDGDQNRGEQGEAGVTWARRRRW